ncbi:MAG: ParA family protein [Candidatus Omnitrophica bacterium]|nr:ParA family protein [Candidatus Omnitrophota bacterium]
MAEILSFCNQKGGVGKTTTAVNIASSFASHNLKTLLIDIDPQANATSGVGVEKSSLEATIYHVLTGSKSAREVIHSSCLENLSILPAKAELTGAEIELIDTSNREFLLREAIAQLCSEFDCIIIDCPPSLNLLTINGLCASTKLIVHLQCEYYALEGLGQLVQTYELIRAKLNPSLEIGGIVLTMADLRTKLAEQVIGEVKKFFGDKVFQTNIPRSIRLSEAPSFGKPALLYDPHGKGTKAYQALAEEMLTRFGLKKQEIKNQPQGETVQQVVSEIGGANHE